MSCIYKITDLVNNKVYVGQTIKSAKFRLKTHWKGRKNKAHSPKGLDYAMNRGKKEDFVVDTLVEGDFNKKLLDELEKHNVRLFASNLSNRGYNLTHGGNSVGDIWTPELREKQRQRMKTAPKSEGFLRSMGRGKNDECKKYVFQCDLDGSPIKEWFGIAFMCRELGLRRRSVVEVLLGIRDFYKGFIFKYKEA